MTVQQLALIVLVTQRLKSKGYRYLAEVENKDTIVIRIFKGLDKS